MQSTLAVGSRVMVAAGIHGTVDSVDDADGTVGLEVAPGVVLTVARAAIVQVLDPEPVDSADPAEQPDQQDSPITLDKPDSGGSQN